MARKPIPEDVFEISRKKALEAQERIVSGGSRKDDDLVKLIVRVTPEMKKSLMMHRAETGESMNALIVRAVERELEL